MLEFSKTSTNVEYNMFLLWKIFASLGNELRFKKSWYKNVGNVSEKYLLKNAPAEKSREIK